MKTAKDIMEKDVISVSPDTEISKAVEILLNNHINGVPVVDADSRLVGILCQSDLIFAQKEIPVPPIFVLLDGIIPLSSSKKLTAELEKMSATTVSQAMVKNVVWVSPDMPISEVATLMVEKHFHTLPVLSEERLVGIIGKEDILKVLITREH